jgi:hypothetical protein
MGAPDRLHARFRKAEVLDLALLDQLLHRASDVFDRHVRIDAVLIEEINALGLQAFERGLGDLPDVLWPAVKARLRVSGFEPELGIITSSSNGERASPTSSSLVNGP